MNSRRKRRAAILSDNVVQIPNEFDPWSRKISQTEVRHTKELADNLSSFCDEVLIYSSLEELVNARHENFILFQNWSGTLGDARLAYIPTICDALEIRHIGADAHTSWLCNDKALKNHYAAQIGFRVNQHVFVECEEDLKAIYTLPLPLVVKPNFESTSLGIEPQSLVYAYEDAEKQVRKIYDKLGQKAICETFTPGREINVAVLQQPDMTFRMEAAERYVLGDEDYLHSRLYDASLKKAKKPPSGMRGITDELPSYLRDLVLSLHSRFEKCPALRIDGRLFADTFTLVEITPNTHLAKNAEFFGSLELGGLSYHDALQILFETTEEYYRRRPSKNS